MYSVPFSPPDVVTVDTLPDMTSFDNVSDVGEADHTTLDSVVPEGSRPFKNRVQS